MCCLILSLLIKRLCGKMSCKPFVSTAETMEYLTHGRYTENEFCEGKNLSQQSTLFLYSLQKVSLIITFPDDIFMYMHVLGRNKNHKFPQYIIWLHRFKEKKTIKTKLSHAEYPELLPRAEHK